MIGISGLEKEYPCEAYIVITGKTNINSFKLSQTPERIPSYLFTSLKEGGVSASRSLISISSAHFKADNQFIYNDFLQLVKASEHPLILVEVPNPVGLSLKNGIGKYDINIFIAGVLRVYTISCTIQRCDKGTVFLSGTQKLKLSDFNLEPPEKTFGLIKVKDEVIINFGFAFEV